MASDSTRKLVEIVGHAAGESVRGPVDRNRLLQVRGLLTAETARQEILSQVSRRRLEEIRNSGEGIRGDLPSGGPHWEVTQSARFHNPCDA